MKKVLITGSNSYIGCSFAMWAQASGAHIAIETVDMKDETWKTKDFEHFDSVFHVAGLAHADIGTISDEQKQLYYKINSDLAIECAELAKKKGVKQFIFMSSIIVYGEGSGIGKQRIITDKTPVQPTNFYGDSKKRAEEGLLLLNDGSFHVVILRPPMIYGKNSKGNFPLLARIAEKFPLFPDIDNQRSMLYIENLCKFVGLLVTNEEQGIFFPQNAEYVKTSDMVKEIATVHGKKIHLTKIFNAFIYLLGRTNGKLGDMINKAFGNLVYEKKISKYKDDYQTHNFKETIYLSEKDI